MSEWIDVWKKEPPHNEEILFATGNNDFHWGEIFSADKLRKCSFHCFICKCDYDCDSQTELSERVIYWSPLPKFPKKLL